MSDCDDQKNKRTTDDGSTVTATTAVMSFNPIGDVLIITTVTATTAVIFLSLRLAGKGQGNVSLTSTSVSWLMSLPIWK